MEPLCFAGINAFKKSMEGPQNIKIELVFTVFETEPKAFALSYIAEPLLPFKILRQGLDKLVSCLH